MERAAVRARGRRHLRAAASLTSTARTTGKGKEKKGGLPHSQADKYRTYANFEVALRSARPHHVLAVNRGEKAKALAVDVVVEPHAEEAFKDWLLAEFAAFQRPPATTTTTIKIDRPPSPRDLERRAVDSPG